MLAQDYTSRTEFGQHARQGLGCNSQFVGQCCDPAVRQVGGAFACQIVDHAITRVLEAQPFQACVLALQVTGKHGHQVAREVSALRNAARNASTGNCTTTLAATARPS